MGGSFPPPHIWYYIPVLPRKRFKQSLITENETATPSMTKAKIPTLVKCPATFPSAGTQTSVSNPLRNSDAKSWINPKLDLMALIISVPMISSFLGKFAVFCGANCLLLETHIYNIILLYICRKQQIF